METAQSTPGTIARSKGIGGSDAPVVSGLSNWKTPLELYLEKTGQLTPEDISDKEHVHFGTMLEDTVAREYMRRTGRKVHRVNTTLQHSKYPWMLANIDRKVEGSRRMLECKTTNPFSFQMSDWGEPGTDEVPDYYLVQCMHYLAVTGYEVADLAVLVGGQKFVLYEIPRSQELIDGLVELEAAFWQKVEDGTAPDPDFLHRTTPALLKKIYPGTNGQIIHLDEDEISATDIYQALVEERLVHDRASKEIKSRETAIISKIEVALGDNSVGLLPDGTGWTRKLTVRKPYEVKGSERINTRFAKKPKVA